MTFRPEGVPLRAETLDLLTYIRTDRTPSMMVPGAEQIATMIACPKCKHERLFRESFRRFNCSQCGLGMCADATRLFVWVEEPAAAPRMENA